MLKHLKYYFGTLNNKKLTTLGVLNLKKFSNVVIYYL